MGVRLGLGTMLLAHIVFNIPYVILSVTPRLKKSNMRLLEVAMDLGATPMQALCKVALPEETKKLMGELWTEMKAE